jgi:hypothetical protein
MRSGVLVRRRGIWTISHSLTDGLYMLLRKLPCRVGLHRTRVVKTINASDVGAWLKGGSVTRYPVTICGVCGQVLAW